MHRFHTRCLSRRLGVASDRNLASRISRKDPIAAEFACDIARHLRSGRGHPEVVRALRNTLRDLYPPDLSPKAAMYRALVTKSNSRFLDSVSRALIAIAPSDCVGGVFAISWMFYSGHGGGLQTSQGYGKEAAD